MAKSHSVTHTQVLNILPLFELLTTSYITTLILYLHLFNFTFSIPITPSDPRVKARVYVRAKAERIKAFKCVAYAKTERKICFQGFRKIPSC